MFRYYKQNNTNNYYKSNLLFLEWYKKHSFRNNKYIFLNIFYITLKKSILLIFEQSSNIKKTFITKLFMN